MQCFFKDSIGFRFKHIFSDQNQITDFGEKKIAAVNGAVLISDQPMFFADGIWWQSSDFCRWSNDQITDFGPEARDFGRWSPKVEEIHQVLADLTMMLRWCYDDVRIFILLMWNYVKCLWNSGWLRGRDWTWTPEMERGALRQGTLPFSPCGLHPANDIRIIRWYCWRPELKIKLYRIQKFWCVNAFLQDAYGALMGKFQARQGPIPHS